MTAPASVDALITHLARVALDFDEYTNQLGEHRLSDADVDLLVPVRAHFRLGLDRLDSQGIEVRRFGYSTPGGRQRLRLAGDPDEHGAPA